MTCSRAKEYRRLARECLEVAHTFQAGTRRTILLQMAQVWQRLADGQDGLAHVARVPPPAAEPVVQQQQQQQVQPKDDDKNE
jgi:hypothetical protein